MSERLTDGQLRAIAAGVMISNRVVDLSDAMAIELLALRARVAELEGALLDIAGQPITGEDASTKHARSFDGIVRLARTALKDAPQ